MKIVRYHLKTISSTNTWAKENQHVCDPMGITLITADAQISGRGRGSRVWVSPPLCNIYASFCFFVPSERWRECGCLTQIAALSMSKIIAELGLDPEIKWPNDVLIAGKKIAGILMELVPGDSTYFVVLGIGLNVNMSSEELALINRPATSLAVESGHPFDLANLLEQLTETFTNDYNLFLQEGFAPFAGVYQQHIQGLFGKTITYQQGIVYGNGIVESMTPEGYLIVRVRDGSLKVLNSGELL
ncbi:MAG: biotin--[acetyl-CoA-carboxylase] ligase [Parachlamydia sp.]|nr:MAG: biotin--[acetyl-CoA-carboxylase] ligase [Parachlamydia sp.]